MCDVFLFTLVPHSFELMDQKSELLNTLDKVLKRHLAYSMQVCVCIKPKKIDAPFVKFEVFG